MGNTLGDTHLFLENRGSSSFIANINKVANEIDTMKDLLELPDTLNEIKTSTENIKNQTNTIYQNTVQIKNATETIKTQTQQIFNTGKADIAAEVNKAKQQVTLASNYATQSNNYANNSKNSANLAKEYLNSTKTEYNNLIKYSNDVKENISDKIDTAKYYADGSKFYSENADKSAELAKLYADKAENASSKVDSALTLEAGIQNIQKTYKLNTNISSNQIINFSDTPYYVGRSTLQISWEGVVLYNGVHYEEIGNDGEVSRLVKFLLPIPKDHKINILVIASNLVRDVHDKLEEIKDIQKEVEEDLEEIKYLKENIESTVALAKGVENKEFTFITTDLISKNTVLYFNDFSYYVGRATLRVNWEGVELYKDIHYEEVGLDGEVSHEIKLLIDIPSNNRLNLWAISSNLSRAVEDAIKLQETTEELLDKADKLNKESEVNANIASNAAQEATEQADRAEEAADDAELAAKRAELNACLINKNGIMTLREIELLEFAPNGIYIVSPIIAVPGLCGLPIISASSKDKIPEGDCFYIITIDIEIDCGDKPVDPEEPDLPDYPDGSYENKAVSICGKRTKII